MINVRFCPDLCRRLRGHGGQSKIYGLLIYLVVWSQFRMSFTLLGDTSHTDKVTH